MVSVQIVLSLFALFISVPDTFGSDAPCFNYKVLNDSWRHIDYVKRGTFPTHCDKTGIVSGYQTNLSWGMAWYRFTSPAGSKLPTGPSPVGGRPSHGGKQICGTYGVAYISSGGNPTIQDGIVTRDICFEYRTHSCWFKSTVKVAACREAQGEYFVYQLQSVPCCSCAYCPID